MKKYKGLVLVVILMSVIALSCNKDDEEKDDFKVVANFTISPQTGTTATEFLFDASSTETIGEWVEIEYEWEFGDGATNYNGSVTETHKYDTPGDYTVLLNVKIYKAGNTGSAGDIVEKTLTVSPVE